MTRNTILYFLAVGIVCVVIGTILTERDRRRRNVAEDIEGLLRKDGIHWQHCPPCDRWYFVQCAVCRRCKGELVTPTKEQLIEFTTELYAFWKELSRATARRPYEQQGYRVRSLFNENEVSGLLWTVRHAERAMEGEGKA